MATSPHTLRPPPTRTAREALDHAMGKVWRALAFWRRALIVFVVASLAAGPIAVTRPLSYRSEAVILYQDRIRMADLTGGGGESSAESTRRLGARLREAMMSRAMLEPIVRDLHLHARVVEERGLVDAVEAMRKQIRFRAREGDTFEIGFEGSSPDEVQEVTRRLATSLVNEASGRRAEHARTLKEFVDAESERNKIELKDKEAALASFLTIHPELRRAPGTETTAPPSVVPDTSGFSMMALEQRAATIASQLASARSANLKEAPKREPAPAATPPSPELIAARNDLADKQARFTDRHPDVLAARVRLRAVEAAQAAMPVPVAIEPAQEGSAPDEESLRQQLTSLQLQIAARRASATATAGEASSARLDAARGAVAHEVEVNRLQREVNDARERQRQLDERQFKATITASSVMNDRNVQVSILDPAYRPTHPSSRPRSMLIAGALILSFLLGLLTAALSAWLDDRIHDSIDLEHLDMVPVLAVIPPATLPSLRRTNAHA